jgi:hypothetical protein
MNENHVSSRHHWQAQIKENVLDAVECGHGPRSCHKNDCSNSEASMSTTSTMSYRLETSPGTFTQELIAQAVHLRQVANKVAKATKAQQR